MEVQSKVFWSYPDLHERHSGALGRGLNHRLVELSCSVAAGQTGAGLGSFQVLMFITTWWSAAVKESLPLRESQSGEKPQMNEKLSLKHMFSITASKTVGILGTSPSPLLIAFDGQQCFCRSWLHSEVDPWLHNFIQSDICVKLCHNWQIN